MLWVLTTSYTNFVLFGRRNMAAIEPLPCNASYWMVIPEVEGND